MWRTYGFPRNIYTWQGFSVFPDLFLRRWTCPRVSSSRICSWHWRQMTTRILHIGIPAAPGELALTMPVLNCLVNRRFSEFHKN